MTNNKFSKERRPLGKKRLKRPEAKSEIRKRALIICEDSDSSPAYFRELIKWFKLTTVLVEPSGKKFGSAPSSLVTYGKGKLKEQYNDFDYIFFVFDKDRHSSYDGALFDIYELQKKYQNIVIKPITSTPCFELWLLLHRKYSTKAYEPKGKQSSGQTLIKDLIELDSFKNYSKSRVCNYFKDIKDDIEVAISHAKKLIQDGKKTDQKDHYINPSTYIHELVISLQEIAKGYEG